MRTIITADNKKYKDYNECYPYYYFTTEYDIISNRLTISICNFFICLTLIMLIFVHALNTKTFNTPISYITIGALSLAAILALAYTFKLWLSHTEYKSIERKLGRWITEDGINPDNEKISHKKNNTYTISGNRGELELTGKNKRYIDGNVLMVDISGVKDFPYRLGCTKQMNRIIKTKQTISALCFSICFLLGPVILYLDKISLIKL